MSGSPVLLSIVIPAYNEKTTIREILRRVGEVELPGFVEREIVVVDDGSTDGTGDMLREMEQRDDPVPFRLFEQPENRGKGALLQPILDNEADVVYGSRFLGGPHRVLYFWHSLGNRFLTTVSNIFTDLNLSDMETGYKVFRREVVDGLELRSRRFGIEPELTAKVARRGARIFEVPISYWGRTYAEGKKIGWKDGVAAVWAILRYNLWRS
jgi:glycosyltransferase involved in cell wall biosynthesis